ncbi:MAG TPA: NAD(P)/FAD-dependent oxidoreductase [Thermoanaerobaculia bacterium]|nr:NAD(P)/FAD-dependent oxidoreductase [Thermoanaerobaculia bacterium]
MTRDDSRDVTLIGAGLAGSLLAIYLARRGFEVAIFERRPDLRRVNIAAGRSINLALANRGIHALREVGLMDRIEPLLIPMAGRMLHDEAGNLQFLPYGSRPEEVIYSVSRGALNGIMMDAAEAGGVTIHFLHNCREVDFEQREVTAIIDDGRARRFPYRTLIGTDGSASAVRDAVMRATGGESREEPLEHSYKELSIPPSPDGGFRIERNALHIWPRGEFMLIALPNIDGSFTVTLFLPNEGPESFASLTTAEAVLSFFERRFADAVPLLPDLTEAFFENPTGHLSTIRCWPWHYRDQAVLLGDAAHAIVPFHGQGMNCAFEDCSELNACLDSSDGTWEPVFAELARRRKPNAEAIADMALENYVEMRSSVRDPKFQLWKEAAFRLEERQPGRFIPRYSMVMFHSIPYAEAKRRGAIQDEILEELTRETATAAEVDYEKADRLIASRLG